MSDQQSADETSTLQTVIDAVVAVRTASELHDAIDVDALLSDDPAGDPVDLDEFADAVGRPVGRAVANTLVDGSGKIGTAKRFISSRIVREVTAGTVRVAGRRFDTDALARSVVELDQERLPGPSVLEELADGDGSTDRTP